MSPGNPWILGPPAIVKSPSASLPLYWFQPQTLSSDGESSSDGSSFNPATSDSCTCHLCFVSVKVLSGMRHSIRVIVREFYTGTVYTGMQGEEKYSGDPMSPGQVPDRLYPLTQIAITGTAWHGPGPLQRHVASWWKPAGREINACPHSLLPDICSVHNYPTLT